MTRDARWQLLRDGFERFATPPYASANEDVAAYIDELKAKSKRAGALVAAAKAMARKDAKRAEKRVARAESAVETAKAATATSNKLRELQAVEWIVPLKALVDDYSTIIRDQRREIARLNQLLSGRVVE